LPKTILAVVDDLMFVSKIRTTASHLGAVVKFARSTEAALAEMRTELPALVIFDLNSPRTNALGTVAAMKSDPALAAVPTLGFASHLQVDVINAARQGGVDEVLAKSAFTEQLPAILGRGL
jgi:CheY-like chemotaxis protein